MSEHDDGPGRPDFYDDLDGLLAAGASLLARGSRDRKSPAHTPTLATVGLDGAPRLRTVVLRGFSLVERTARVHSDARAGKLEELRADARAGLHAYHVGQKLQVRLSGRMTVHAGDEIAAEIWAGMRGFSKRCYFAQPAPGSPVSEPTSGIEGVDLASEVATKADRAAFANFAVLILAFHSLEVLYLHADGHRRARARWAGEGADGARETAWLVP